MDNQCKNIYKLTCRLDAIADFRVKPSVYTITVVPVTLIYKTIAKGIRSSTAWSHWLPILPLCFKFTPIGEIQHPMTVKPTQRKESWRPVIPQIGQTCHKAAHPRHKINF